MKLAEWVKARLKAERMSQRELANSIAISEQLLTRSLKKNVFTVRAVEAIAEILDGQSLPLEVEAWTEKVGVVFEPIVQRARRKQAGKRYGDKVDAIQVYRNMSSDDVTVCNSLNVLPLEMDNLAGKQLMKAAANAVWNGATFVYLTPHEDWVQRTSEIFKYAPPALHDIKKIFASYREDIVEELVGIHGVSRKKQITEIVAERLHHISCDGRDSGGSAFWLPYMTLAATLKVSQEGIMASMSMRLPCDSPFESPILWLRDCTSFTNEYARFIKSTLSNWLGRTLASKPSRETKDFVKKFIEQYCGQGWGAADHGK